jgi:hypothetical protein
MLPFFSPDGLWVGFYDGRNLNKISVEGGPVVTLANVANTMVGVSWAEDGSIFTSDFAKGVQRICRAWKNRGRRGW